LDQVCISLYFITKETSINYIVASSCIALYFIGDTIHCQVGTVCPYWTYGEDFLQRVKTLK